jgi:hypothetical protein
MNKTKKRKSGVSVSLKKEIFPWELRNISTWGSSSCSITP